MTGEQGRQDRPPRDPHDLRGHRDQPAISIFQELLYTIDQGHPLLNTGVAIAGQVPQLPLGHRQNNAGAPQAMLQEFGQPSRIFDIGLAPRDNSWQGYLKCQMLTCVLEGDSRRCLQGLRVRLLDRLGAPVLKTTWGPTAQPELYHNFMGGGDQPSGYVPDGPGQALCSGCVAGVCFVSRASWCLQSQHGEGALPETPSSLPGAVPLRGPNVAFGAGW